MNLPNYYPDTAKIDNKGNLEIGGYDLEELAERFGTPLYVLDEQTIRNSISAYKSALAEFYPNSLVIFACKALCIQALCAICKQESIGLDVVSAGELHTAKSVNFPAERIYLHGNNKSRQELEMISELEEARVIIDNFHDIKLLKDINKPIKALLRITPGIECHTHEYIKTGHIDSKFGFDLEQLDEAVEEVLSAENIQLIGVHAHIGSQIFESQPFADLAGILLGRYARIQKHHSLPLTEINLGGGFGVNYTNADNAPSIHHQIQTISSYLLSNADTLNIDTPRLIVEPGRSLVARAGITLYTLGAQKTTSTDTKYFSLDGGMADNPRPITYKAKHASALVKDPYAQERDCEVYTLAGRYCESGDVLIQRANLPKTASSGDLIAMLGTGAYNYSMSSNYNRSPRPAMVLLNEGEAEVILQRESLDDLLSHDVLPGRFQAIQGSAFS